jgi:hypothetical protein
MKIAELRHHPLIQTHCMLRITVRTGNIVLECQYDQTWLYYLSHIIYFIIPHNLLIVDYALGHSGSVHDAYALRSTHIYQEHDTLLPPDHWVWADSTYPLSTWCITPFKMPHNGCLTANQRTFNFYLSSVCTDYMRGLQVIHTMRG